jgi:serpin B
MHKNRTLELLALLASISLTPATGRAQPSASPAEVQAVVNANNQFALDLYNQLGKAEGNLFFSPYSINKTLAMVYAGARGDTEKEMAAVLHFGLGQSRLHQAFLRTRTLLNQRNPVPGPDVQLYLGANLWGQRGYHFEKRFVNLVHECYGGGFEEADFAASEQARTRINNWVEKQTRSKIKDLFPPGSIDLSTRLVLASAIYFKGEWANRFKKSSTRDESFCPTASSKVQIRMMSQTDNFGYFEDADCQALRMPYQGQKLAMMVFLPTKKDGLADLEKALTGKRLADSMERFRAQKVTVGLPRFKMTQAFALKEPLTALGMRRAFGAGADFSGMAREGESLYVSSVHHKAFVDVNEEGTEAAAATGAAIGALSIGPPGPRIPVFWADHPFAFAIYDVRTGLVLFLGRVVNPQSERNLP